MAANSASANASSTDEREVLRVAAAVEAGSERPSAAAIVERAARDDLSFASGSDFEASAGHGAHATVDGTHAIVGNERLMRDHDIDVAALRAVVADAAAAGRTAVYVARDDAPGRDNDQ